MGPFETERLTLRNMEEGDVPILRELLYRDREVWGMYSGIGGNPERLTKSFAHYCSQAPNASFGRQVVVDKSSQMIIGQIHLDPYVNDYNLIPGEPSGPN